MLFISKFKKERRMTRKAMPRSLADWLSIKVVKEDKNYLLYMALRKGV